MTEDEEAERWYEKQKKQARDAAVKYYLNHLKGGETIAKSETTEAKTKQPTDDRG